MNPNTSYIRDGLDSTRDCPGVLQPDAAWKGNVRARQDLALRNAMVSPNHDSLGFKPRPRRRDAERRNNDSRNERNRQPEWPDAGQRRHLTTARTHEGTSDGVAKTYFSIASATPS